MGGSPCSALDGAVFANLDVVLCPPGCRRPAFPHDHTPVPERHIEIEGKQCSFFDSIGLAGGRDHAGAAGNGGADRAHGRRPAGRRGLRRPLSRRPHAACFRRADRARVRRLRAAAGLRPTRLAASARSSTHVHETIRHRVGKKSFRVRDPNYAERTKERLRPGRAFGATARCPHRRARTRPLCDRRGFPRRARCNRTAIFTAASTRHGRRTWPCLRRQHADRKPAVAADGRIQGQFSSRPPRPRNSRQWAKSCVPDAC